MKNYIVEQRNTPANIARLTALGDTPSTEWEYMRNYSSREKADEIAASYACSSRETRVVEVEIEEEDATETRVCSCGRTIYGDYDTCRMCAGIRHN